MMLYIRMMILMLLVLPAIGETREQNAADVPIAVTAFSAEEISSTGIADVNEVVSNINTLRFASIRGVSTDSSRGVSTHSIRGVPPDSVLVLVDGVRRPSTVGTGGLGTPGLSPYDIERVEVLPGPQGSLFGRANAPGISRTYNATGDWVINIPDLSNVRIDPSYRVNTSSDREFLGYINETIIGQFSDGEPHVSFSPTSEYNEWRDRFSKVDWDFAYNNFRDAFIGNIDPTFGFDLFSMDENKRILKKSEYPNDPLYPKKGSTGKVSGARKALGAIFSIVQGPVSVSKGEASGQWGLPETGFHRRGSGKSAWDVASGGRKNVVVAVIDSGLDMDHVDRPQHVWTNGGEIAGNGIDDDQNGYVDDIHGWNFYSESNDINDDNGHGTFVAGIIAANTNNGEGMAGINPGARIMPLKVLNEEGKSRILAVYRAIRYAVDNGARVINLSLGGKGVTRIEQIGINYAYAMGCIVVVAAGNENTDISRHGPPGARRAFSVAALNMDGKPRESSNRGLNVALTAPGHSIYSLAATKGNRDGKFMPIIVGKYFRASGTSFSAPFVTGTASLIWSEHPNLSNRMVEDMILQSANDAHDQGWDPHTGYGLLDGYRALTTDPKELLVPRVTEVYVNKEKRRIASVDLFGVIRGNLEHYTVSVGRGKKPDKWQKVLGPVSEPVDHRLIGRIDGAHFTRGSKWTVRIDAVDRKQRIKTIEVLVSKG